MSSPVAAQGSKPVIVGLFGIPGSGKSTLKFHLENDEICKSRFLMFEGSELIGSIVPGGLHGFKRLEDPEKVSWREKAMRHISEQCIRSKKMGIVTGHSMFWHEGEPVPESILTPEDWNGFTHVFYLDLPVERIKAQIDGDAYRRDRVSASVTHLDAWKQHERAGLETLCMENGVSFHRLNAMPEDVLDDTLEHLNHICVIKKLDSVAGSYPSEVRTVLVLDGDKTLIAEDTGDMFWKLHQDLKPLKKVFEPGYSFRTFREATSLYREADGKDFEGIAKAVSIRPEFLDLLQSIKDNKHLSAIVVTCGLKQVWDNILDEAGVAIEVEVIGCEVDGITITPDLKGALVDRLHNVHRKIVWAFGDSPMDLPMLCKADQAIVVVGEKGARSQSMEAKLAEAIGKGLEARQILMQLKKDAPLPDGIQLPQVQLQDGKLVQSIFEIPQRLECFHATEKSAAKLLMSATRNAECRGPALVDAHRRMGLYLATEYLGDVLGTETYDMTHVQGGVAEGHRLKSENNTVIIPLMRGGEPMARGVWEAFPTAMYAHAKNPSDLHEDHITGRKAIVLVDGVVNTGKSVVDFVKHIRAFNKQAKIVVVAGVVQAEAVEEGGILERLLNRYGGLSLVALRVSKNKYTGKGSTDTGHRLFNTTHMD